MQWIAPSKKDTTTAALEKRLWDAADQFRANSGLKSQEYSVPVLGLIFLRFAEVRFSAQRTRLEQSVASPRRCSRVDDPAAYHAEGILYLPAVARFDYLLGRPKADQRPALRIHLRIIDQRLGIVIQAGHTVTLRVISGQSSVTRMAATSCEWLAC